MVQIEEMKKVISEGFPIITSIENQPILILGYDNEKESFFCRVYGGSGESVTDKWLPYSTTFDDECWYSFIGETTKDE